MAVLFVTFANTGQSLAASQSVSPAPRVSFTFDDGLASAYTQAAPTLAKYGLTGTDYVITNCVGMTKAPNKCRANTDTTYMTWAQVQAMQNSYGWEIGSHTVDHQCLASNSKIDPDDCQKNTLTMAQVDQELSGSKSALASHGINATDFAPPYGDYNNSVLAEIAKYYGSMRNFKNAAATPNVWPYSDYYLQDFVVQETTTPVASVEAQIDKAIAANQWLVLTFHDIASNPSKDPDDYQYGTAELDQIAAYVKTKVQAGLIQSVHVNQGLVTGGANLLSNSSFNDGIADGWTTDAPTTVTKDSLNNGSYPDPSNSVKLVSGASTGHLFSPVVSVDPNTSYMLKSFLNVKAITSGEVGFYIDEYDVNGNWISGQYKAGEKSSFVESMNFGYKPTSLSVAKASLQVIVAGSGITAYLDNCQWYALTTSTPAPTQPNLVANGTFDDGVADGWTTDAPATIVSDSTSKGSPQNPQNSVKVTASANNTHLFSPKVAVDSTKSYSLSAYVNLIQIATGEIGFYVDEYDASGNWISGQYITGYHTLGASTINFSYKPSSANVKYASLQIIVVGNSSIVAYIDNITWYLL